MASPPRERGKVLQRTTPMNRLLSGMSVLALTLIATSAPGQYPYRPYPAPYPYPNPYYPGSGYGYGNTLSGAADLNRSYGDVSVQYEQARILRQQTEQAKIDTKKKAFDEMLYE